jgi:retron-type reverse transcriptase
MARSFNNLWQRFISFENIFRAFREASNGKRYRWESLYFARDLEVEIITLINELEWDMYEARPYRRFRVYEPKKRLISAPAFRDRVVHHALVQIIGPLFENRFVSETYACMIGRGTHAAVKHSRECIIAARNKWDHYYVLKGDVSDFFASVDQDIMRALIRRVVADKKILRLIDKIIQSHESADRDGKGIPIGALTSQLFANVYLDPLDHFLKEVCQVKYYARYMDDFVILHNDKNYLRELMGKIETFLHDKLKLNLNPKTGIFPISHGVNFCGYRIWPTHTKPRKSTVKRAKKRFRKFVKNYKIDPMSLVHAQASIQSFLGYMIHCNGYKTTAAILDRLVFSRGDTQTNYPDYNVSW